MLYLQPPPAEADPQAISGRTSYLRVRLAFHPYPQLLRALCHGHRFGPPRRSPPRFSLARGSSPGFGSAERNLPPSSDSLSLRLQVPPPSPRYARPLAGSCSNRHAVTRSRRLRPPVGARFQALFHPPRRGPFHRSLTVLSTIGRPGYLALERWSPQLPTGFLVPRGTHVPAPHQTVPSAYGTLTLSGRPFQQRSAPVPPSAASLPPRPGWPSNPTPA